MLWYQQERKLEGIRGGGKEDRGKGTWLRKNKFLYVYVSTPQMMANACTANMYE